MAHGPRRNRRWPAARRPCSDPDPGRGSSCTAQRRSRAPARGAARSPRASTIPGSAASGRSPPPSSACTEARVRRAASIAGCTRPSPADRSKARSSRVVAGPGWPLRISASAVTSARRRARAAVSRVPAEPRPRRRARRAAQPGHCGPSARVAGIEGVDDVQQQHDGPVGEGGLGVGGAFVPPRVLRHRGVEAHGRLVAARGRQRVEEACGDEQLRARGAQRRRPGASSTGSPRMCSFGGEQASRRISVRDGARRGPHAVAGSSSYAGTSTAPGRPLLGRPQALVDDPPASGGGRAGCVATSVPTLEQGQRHPGEQLRHSARLVAGSARDTAAGPVGPVDQQPRPDSGPRASTSTTWSPGTACRGVAAAAGDDDAAGAGR